jgi:hypothetical protein
LKAQLSGDKVTMESELKGLFDREVKKEVRGQRSEVKQQQKMNLKEEKDDNQVPIVRKTNLP